jgi:hypothetical protein
LRDAFARALRDLQGADPKEQVFPETRAAWGQARPPCPGHAHPASAELVGDHAMWICPSSGQPLARIGYLHEEERECP